MLSEAALAQPCDLQIAVSEEEPVNIWAFWTDPRSGEVKSLLLAATGLTGAFS